jgi:hypothetical protein
MTRNPPLLTPTALLPLPRLSHSAHCACWICTLDAALPVVEYQAELDRARTNDAADERADMLYLESLSPDELELELAARCEEARAA